MMIVLFSLILLTVLIVWRGFRTLAMVGFGISLFLAVIGFIHHISTQLNIQL